MFDKSLQESSSNLIDLYEQELSSPMMIYIHEFSTGISAKIGADGKWRSGGLTGQYMNSTLSSIPQSVEQAIYNRQFEIAGKIYKNEPAFIARIVVDENEPNSSWSVIAVVTCEQHIDETTFFAYRYFLSEGSDRLNPILAWMLDRQQQYGILPTFNPSEVKSAGEPNKYQLAIINHINSTPEVQTWIDNVNTPVIIPNKLYSLQEVALLAELISKRSCQDSLNNIPKISWAFNVEKLERPEDFYLIQTIDNGQSLKSNEVAERVQVRIQELRNELNKSQKKLNKSQEECTKLRSKIDAKNKEHQESISESRKKLNELREEANMLLNSTIYFLSFFGIFGCYAFFVNGDYPGIKKVFVIIAFLSAVLPIAIAVFINWIKNRSDS